MHGLFGQVGFVQVGGHDARRFCPSGGLLVLLGDLHPALGHAQLLAAFGGNDLKVELRQRAELCILDDFLQGLPEFGEGQA